MPPRTCETCLYEDCPPSACQHCGPGMSEWKPKLAAQLAEKDRVIERLSQACQTLLLQLCGQCSYGANGKLCTAYCEEKHMSNELREALAQAKKVGA